MDAPPSVAEQDVAMTTTRIVFIHGAGEGARADDEALVSSLSESLGYEVVYPELPNEDEPDPDTWGSIIRSHLPAVVVAHSVGASIAAKYSEGATALFLIAAPYWGGEGWHYEGWEDLALPEGAAFDMPVFLYQGRDDEVVPFTHLALWSAAIPSAVVREIDGADHQLGGDLSVVADDIRSLSLD